MCHFFFKKKKDKTNKISGANYPEAIYVHFTPSKGGYVALHARDCDSSIKIIYYFSINPSDFAFRMKSLNMRKIHNFTLVISEFILGPNKKNVQNKL